MLKLFYFRWNLVISDLAVEDKNSCYFCFRRILKVFIRVFWALSYLFILLVRAFLPCYRYSTLAPQSHEDVHQLWALSDCYFFLLPCLLFLALLLLYHECCRFERVFFTLRSFYFTLLPYIWCMYQLNLHLSRFSWELKLLPWKLHVLPLWFETQTFPLCLFEFHSVHQKLLLDR